MITLIKKFIICLMILLLHKECYAVENLLMGNIDSTIYGGGTVYNDLVVVPIYNVTPGKVLLINPDTFTIVNTVTLLSAESNLADVVAPSGLDYAWVCTFTSPVKLIKIQLSTATRVGSLTLNSGENYCFSLSYKDGFVYVGIQTVAGTNNKLVKVNGDTMTRVDILGFGAIGTGNGRSQKIDGNYLYICGELTTNPNIAKIDLNTFTVSNTGYFQNDTCQALTTSGNYLFAVGHVNLPLNRIDRFSKSDLSFVDFLLTSSTNALRNVTSGNGYVYVKSTVSPTKVYKINSTAFTEESSMTPSLGASSAYSPIAYATAATGNFLFTDGLATPVAVIKINPDTMVEVGTLSSGISGANNIDGIDVR
jgi:hypothetical protein